MTLKNKILIEADSVTINSRKFDGKIHRTWNANFIKRENSLLIFVGVFDKEVNHPDLGVIGRGTVSYEFFWLNRCYNIFRFHEPNGDLRNYYCNINLPPTFVNGVLDYIDLDIDLLVWKDFSYQVLDSDEFEENAKRFSYSTELRQKIQVNLDELISMVENKSFPFNEKF